MPQTRTISPFLATMPGVDDRILQDIGLDANGNLADPHDPRAPRPASGRRFFEQLLTALLSLRGIMLIGGRRAESRLLKAEGGSDGD